MKLRTGLCILIAVIFTGCCGCIKGSSLSNDIVYKRKGFIGMEKKLKPEILDYDYSFESLNGLNIKNSIGMASAGGKFAILSINKEGIVDHKIIKENFPPHFGQEYFSDSEHNLMWMKRGRGFYALDIESKKSGHTVASGDGNKWIHNAFVADPKNKIFFIEVVGPPPDPKKFTLYDLINDRDIFTSPDYEGVMYPLTGNLLLYCEFYERTLLRWQIIDFNFKKQKGNKLTKRLNKIQIKVWPYSKSFHFGKRMMLGTADVIGKLTYFSIRWDEKLEDIKIEPIILQLPKRGVMDSNFVFSSDGNWVKAIILPEDEGLFPPSLVFFHASGIYPQGLSMPIPGGYTREDNPGAFFNHEEWGPCYMEHDPDMRGKLFIYKMNDGLELLRDMAMGE
ncbi:MAG: hypothetical protein GY754_36135 [bacterium]|nr:hypothetical protein [bacterium]